MGQNVTRKQQKVPSDFQPKLKYSNDSLAFGINRFDIRVQPITHRLVDQESTQSLHGRIRSLYLGQKRRKTKTREPKGKNARFKRFRESAITIGAEEMGI